MSWTQGTGPRLRRQDRRVQHRQHPWRLGREAHVVTGLGDNATIWSDADITVVASASLLVAVRVEPREAAVHANPRKHDDDTCG
ncbi:MAG: hypothetical protein HOQ05_12550 [Corynebacteriales bacterium]|nr:hypothetical protein [Mycobacteriales bacterium]